MLYHKPLIFMKPNGGASGASRQRGGGNVSYEGTSKGYANVGSFNNPGYDKIKDLPAGAEFTVSSSRLSPGIEDRRYRVVMVNGERQLVIMNNNGKRNLVYNSAATADTSHFSRNITDADLRRLVGDDARKITIHNGGNPINSSSRDKAEEAYHALLRSGQELGRTEYRVIDAGRVSSSRNLGSNYTNKAGLREVINSPDGTVLTVHSHAVFAPDTINHYRIEHKYDGTYIRRINEQGRIDGSHSTYKINSIGDFTRRTTPNKIIVHGRDLDQEARASAKTSEENMRNINRYFREMKARQRQSEATQSSSRGSAVSRRIASREADARQRAENARQRLREEIAAANRNRS